MKEAVKKLVVKAPVKALKALKALVKEPKKTLKSLVKELAVELAMELAVAEIVLVAPAIVTVMAVAAAPTHNHNDPKEFLNKIPNSRSWSNP